MKWMCAEEYVLIYCPLQHIIISTFPHVGFYDTGFCSFTGYERNEIEGKNCRFLQGKGTLPEDVDKIRKAIREETQTHVNLLNYRKDGSSFNNEFFISPIRKASDETKILYYLGVQTSVPRLGPGQMPSNPG